MKDKCEKCGQKFKYEEIGSFFLANLGNVTCGCGEYKSYQVWGGEQMNAIEETVKIKKTNPFIVIKEHRNITASKD